MFVPHPTSYAYSTTLPCIDFETYSEAGFVLDIKTFKWSGLPNAPTRGLKSVGACVYSQHKSTEVLSIAYDLKDNKGARLWHPSLTQPNDLLSYVKNGGLIEAWNSSFEWDIWNNVCCRKFGCTE